MPEEETQTSAVVTPYLYYENVEEALAWLVRVFGCKEREVETMRNENGKIVHSAVLFGEGAVMIGCPGPDYRCPKNLGQATQNLYVYVEDVVKHCEQAKSLGAKVLSELEDTFYGDKRYGVEDLEGHNWYFAQKVQDIKPEDWKPTKEDLAGHG